MDVRRQLPRDTAGCYMFVKDLMCLPRTGGRIKKIAEIKLNDTHPAAVSLCSLEIIL